MPLQRFEIADDDSQKIIEVMGDTARELTDALHFLRLDQTLFGRAPLGQVARDLRKTDDVAFGIADRIDHGARPEPASIFADPPALRLVLAGPRRGLDRLVRNLPFPIFIGIEAREMLSDDLFARIALDALRAGIPIDDRSAGIEHENGVVGYALDQNPKPAFAVLQFGRTRGELRRPLGYAFFQRAVEFLQLLFRLLACGHFVNASLVKA